MAGIYIHIPFCKQRCTYCDFHFSTTFESYRSRMVEAMATEIQRKGQEYKVGNEEIKTLYFGGGTPSLLHKEELALLVNTVNTFFGNTYVECTLEANPDDITLEKVKEWKRLGINRLSIGLQSFKENDLKWMNRAHNVEQSYSCVEIAIAGGIENITVDLMYGLPALTDEEWKSHVYTVSQMGVQHVSAYCLTIEERTAMANKVAKEELVVLDEEQQARQFEILIQTLKEQGFNQYEISNFAKEGFESKHNSAYWTGEHYFGIGPSAHSFNGSNRSWNLANNSLYMKNIEANQKWFEEEVLTSIDRFNELILTGLRMSNGLSIERLNNILPLDNSFLSMLQAFEKEGLLLIDHNYIVLTHKGRLQADHIASELFKVND